MLSAGRMPSSSSLRSQASSLLTARGRHAAALDHSRRNGRSWNDRLLLCPNGTAVRVSWCRAAPDCASAPVPPGNVQDASPFGTTQPAGVLANPLRVPVGDRDFAFEQIVAVIEEDFKVQHEEPVRVAGDISPRAASTLFPKSRRRYWSRGAVTRSLSTTAWKARCKRIVAERLFASCPTREVSSWK